MNDKDMNGGEKTMKSNRKKRIIAAVLCMVMVLSSSISALAGEEIFVDIPEASEEFSSEPMVVTETESAGEAFTETEASPEISFSDGDVTADVEIEAPVDPKTPAETAPEVPEETPSEEAVPETPADESPAEEENFADFGDGMSDSVADAQILSEETELKQEFVDETGNVVQRVTAKLPAGAFAAETSSITMEVSYLDADSESYLKSMMNENIPEGMLLGSYVFFNVQFKVNGEKAESLKPVEITIEGSGLTITDIKKTNVFYFDPADPSVEGDKDELKEIPQRAEVLESLQASGQSTENIEDYDLSEITFREDGTTDKVIFEGRKSTIYGCYTEEVKPEEEIPAEPAPVPEEITPIPEEPVPEKPGTAEEPETASEIEIISDEVNLRTEPDEEAENVIATASMGERFPLLENVQMEEVLWYKIQYTYPETGETAELYVRSDFAKVVDDSLEATDDETVDLTEEPGMVNELTYEDEKITVSVSASEEGIIPDGASLSVKPITAENAETQEQYEEVAQHVEQKVAEEEKKVVGFLAYDISFLDAEGNKVEPNGEVKVSMNYKQAAIPETVTEEKAETTEVSVLHLEEDETGAVQNVVDMTAEESAAAAVQTTENAEIQSAEFNTTSFSVYTVVWKDNNGKKKTLTMHFVKAESFFGDDISKELGVEETEINISGTGNFNNISTSLEEIGTKYNTLFDTDKSTGYKFKAAHIDRKTGTVVTNISYNNNSGGWVYYADSKWNKWTSGKGQTASEKEVYLVYEKVSKGNVREIQTINAPGEKIDIDLFNYNAKINETDAAQQGFKFHSNVRGVDGSFSAGKDLTYTHAYNQKIHQDYLKRNLEDGFPRLTNGTSLKYLFEQSSQNGVTAYPNLTGLLSKDAEGYYNYDSSTNHAQLTDNNSKLTVYNAKLSPWWNDFPYGNFLPFNKLPFDVKNGSENSVTGGRTMTDVWFGMNISFSFMQPKDGRLNRQPMSFDFRGDDDVWVFIDGVKVLDIGGIHDKKEGSINFQTGKVSVQGFPDVSLADLYKDAYVEENPSAGTDQVANYLDSIFKKIDGKYTTFKNFSAHDFRFFYLERGGGAANCKLRFNIPAMDKDSINVSKEIENYDEGAYSDVEFFYELYVNGKQTPEKNVPYTLTHADGSTKILHTDENSGRFILRHGEQARFDQYDQGKQYFVKEVGISSQTYDHVTIQASGVVDEYRQPIEDGMNSAQSQELEVGTNPTVTFLNRCAVTNMKHLVIKKILANGSSNDKYQMNVTVGGKPYTGKYKVGTDYDSAMASEEQSADENGIVTLGAGQVAVILGNAYSTSSRDGTKRGIPSGTSFRVEELKPNGDYVTPEYKVDNAQDSQTSNGFSGEGGFASGVIELQHNAEVTVTNQQPGTVPDPDPLDDVPHNKYIDFLGSGTNGQTNLTGAEYYRLYLDVKGIPNTIPEPADIVLVLDYSSSMGQKFSDATRWDYVKESAKIAVNTLLPDNREQNNRIGIVWFDERANEKNVNFTSDKSHLLNNINNMEYDSGTNYQAAFWNVQDMLRDHGRSDSKKFVIFVTDGEPYQYCNNRWEQKPLSKGLEKAKEKAVEAAKLFTDLNGFYAVSVGTDTGKAFLRDEIVKNVNAADKNTLIASDSAALTEAFSTILGSITKQIGNVTIRDSLSEYVNFASEAGEDLRQYDTDKDGVISGSNNDTTASKIGLKVNISEYENADVYNAHTNIRKAKEYQGNYTYKIDLDAKTIEVNFGKDYFLERDKVYTISFNVMLTDQATQEKVNQNGVKGDAFTDYPENNTSSEQLGLYSNKEASLTFERAVNGKVESDTKKDYEKPVVQPYEKADWQIVKINASDTLKLSGAQFTLSKDKKVCYTGTSDEQGIVKWVDANGNSVVSRKIEKGVYILQETAAPKGYTLSTDTWNVEIGSEGMKPIITEIKTQNRVELIKQPDSSIYELKIKNTPLYDLPSTGGNGIYVYMIGGVALMMAAMFILYKMKCKGVRNS